MNWDWLNPCQHRYEVLEKLPDPDGHAVKFISWCRDCGKLKETTFQAPGCRHKWVTTQQSNLYDAGEGSKKGDVPFGIVMIQRCERCGDVRRKDLVGDARKRKAKQEVTDGSG